MAVFVGCGLQPWLEIEERGRGRGILGMRRHLGCGFDRGEGNVVHRPRPEGFGFDIVKRVLDMTRALPASVSIVVCGHRLRPAWVRSWVTTEGMLDGFGTEASSFCRDGGFGAGAGE